MNAACQAMIFFGGKVRFVLAHICSRAVIVADDNVTMIMKKLKRELGC